MDSHDLTPEQLHAEDRLQHMLTVLHYLGCAETTGRRGK
jgi:hypothetical protein